MKREAKWRKLMEEEEARMRRAKLEEKNRKEEERRKKEKEADDAWEELRHKDEWQTMILPEGWSIFGQTNFKPISIYHDKRRSK